MCVDAWIRSPRAVVAAAPGIDGFGEYPSIREPGSSAYSTGCVRVLFQVCRITGAGDGQHVG